jgi:phosphinothricin acetyltransferase
VFDIKDADEADVPAMTEIQNAFLMTTTHEYTERPHRVAERRRWLAAQRRAGRPVLVARDDADVIGWTSYGRFRDDERWPGYRFAVEHTVHVRESHWGRGVGRSLLRELECRARRDGVHVMIAGIDSANVRSIAFHERAGFVECARIREVGRKFDTWLDLVLMQRVLTASNDPHGYQRPC